MAKAHVLPPSAAVAATMSICVAVVVVAWLAAAAPVNGGGSMTGASVVGMPLLMAARGGGGRVEDEEALEMDSEAHRRVVLALRGQPSPGNKALDRNTHWCDRTCPGKPGDPYVPDPRGCLKIYRCPGGT